jgi:hypothetical protein
LPASAKKVTGEFQLEAGDEFTGPEYEVERPPFFSFFSLCLSFSAPRSSPVDPLQTPPAFPSLSLSFLLLFLHLTTLQLFLTAALLLLFLSHDQITKYTFGTGVGLIKGLIS